MIVKHGQYTGDGNATQGITGVGFLPDLVIVRRIGSTDTGIVHAYFRITGMPANESVAFREDAAFQTGYINSLDADGFTVDTEDAVNFLDDTYYYVAVKDNISDFAVGIYKGNGNDGLAITGLNFQPDYVCIEPDSAIVGAHAYSSEVGDLTSMWFGGGGINRTDLIVSFDENGFTVNNGSGSGGNLVNVNGVDHAWFAFKNVVGKCKVMNYTGDGNDDRNIAVGDAALTPVFALLKGDLSEKPIARFKGNTGDQSQEIDNSVIWNNLIQSFGANTFQVGDDNRINQNTKSYNVLFLADDFTGTTTFVPEEDEIRIIQGKSDITESVARNSLKVFNILTNQIDTCKFKVRKYGTYKYEPINGQIIEVFDGTTKIFEGNITKINEVVKDYAIVEYDVECSDYGRALDRFLINDSFTSQSINDIIDFIVADKGLDIEGFTTNNVDAPKVVDFIQFRYEQFSDVLTQLANLFNGDWYVDIDKDIHLFAKDTTAASFDIQDDNGSYLQGSLKIRRDNSQVANVIYVRGGEYLGANFTVDYVSDGIQNTLALPYKFDSVRVNVTGERWDGGLDTIDTPSEFDYMWNDDEKFVEFRDDRIPNDTSDVKVWGRPFLPVIFKLSDKGSIANMKSIEGGSGEYEKVIIDPSIDSRGAAGERALAELEAYKNTLEEGTFSTYNSGLRAGQTIRINSAVHGIDDEFVINKIIYEPWTEGNFVYRCTFISTRKFGIIEFLRKLLLQDNRRIVVKEGEILNTIESLAETMSLGITFTSSIDHNRQTEAMSVDETVTSQHVDYPVQFVLGPHTWGGEDSGDTKRVFILGGSHLGDFN